MKSILRLPAVFCFISGLLLILYYIFLCRLPGGQHLGFILVGLLSIVLFGGGFFLWHSTALIPRKIWRRFRITSFLFLSWLVSFVLVVGLILANAQTTEIQDPDYLIILGAGLNGDKPDLTLQQRLDTGLSYLQNNPSLPIIVTGGQCSKERISEGLAMSNYLQAHGIAKERIIVESASQSTKENFLFSAKILEELGEKQPVTIMIATSDFHLLRSKLLAKRNGFQAGSLAAPSPLYLLPANLLREYFASGKSLLLDW